MRHLMIVKFHLVVSKFADHSKVSIAQGRSLSQSLFYAVEEIIILRLTKGKLYLIKDSASHLNNLEVNLYALQKEQNHRETEA